MSLAAEGDHRPGCASAGTVAAVVNAPTGPIVVYGTVTPWANERMHDDGSRARMWDVHRAEIERQGADWLALRAAYPDPPLVVAGDVNQDRDGSWASAVLVTGKSPWSLK